MWKACVSKLYGTAYILLLSNQTGNKHFVYNLSGSQLIAALFVIAGTYWKNQVPESSAKILTI